MNKTIPTKIYKLLGADKLSRIYKCHAFHATEKSLEFCIRNDEINFIKEDINFIKIEHDAETDLFDISFRLYDYFGMEVISAYIYVHPTYLRDIVFKTMGW